MKPLQFQCILLINNVKSSYPRNVKKWRQIMLYVFIQEHITRKTLDITDLGIPSSSFTLMNKCISRNI